MIPAAFVRLDRLPLTPNGKLDRKALPSPDAEQLRRDTAYTPPRTPTQEVIAEIWKQLLGVSRVGIRDNFYALGGHSLIAAQIHARLRAVFGVEVSIRLLFQEPTVADLARHVDESRQAVHDQPPLVPQARPEDLPLSFAQRRAWFFEQWETDSPLNNIISGLRLQGRLDVTALARALSTVAARHEALRTVFTTESGEPLQVVVPAAPVDVPLIDLTGLPEAERDKTVRHLALAEVRLRFDLTRGPLLRTRLLRLTADDHVLLISLHHIISDGQSLELLLHELTLLYNAEVAGESATLPELPIQYADYALWQRTWLRGPVLERQLTYWREQLAGAPALLELPTDRPRPRVLGFEGASRAFNVPDSVRQAVHRVSRRVGATPFMTLLAVFNVILARYSGQGDVVVGTPIGHRPTVETEPLIGYFSNTLVLRTEVSGELTFAQLVARVRDVCLDAYAHQDVPFEQLVEELRPARDTSYTPLAQVGCDYQRAPAVAIDWPGVEVRPLEPAPGNGTAKFDLALTLTETPDVLAGNIIYNTDLFTPETIARFTGRLLTALETLTAEPQRRLSELTWLSPAEIYQITQVWSHPPEAETPRLGLHELVAAQAVRTPDAVAVSCGDEQLTYAALDAQVDDLARYLRAMGVGQDVRVAACLPRIPLLVISLLAVMKAGGAYLPLDPTYPADRLSFMLDDSQAGVLLTDGGLPVAATAAKVIRLDRPWPHLTDQPLPSTSLDDLAYVIYTSGSTGTPKGTMVAHRGIAALAHAQATGLGLGPGSRVLQFASLSFDASILELLMALPSGGTLCLTGPDRPLPGPDLTTLLDRQAITAVMLPPSALAATPGTDLPALTTVTVGGEACTPELVERWAPGRRFHNLYGPTEATICSSMTACHPGTPVTIGRPIADCRAYVLDENLQALPAGIPGQHFLGGPALARGYWNRPALTAERFIPDPFSTTPGARLYRTGDRVRFEPNGELAFLGRTDHQLKLRGYRIEPGEIEATLRAHPAITSAAVLLREDLPGTTRLVAYVTSDAGVTSAELREHCGRDLPDYMIPAAFVQLDELPLMPNGKLDRRALPAPEAGQDSDMPHSPPQTPDEQTLADIWARVLGLPRVGRDNNFFALGGDSILAIQVITLAKKAGLPLTPKLLFEKTTVAQLIAAVGDTTIVPSSDEQGAVTGPVVPPPIQRWFLDQKLPVPGHYNQSILLRPSEPLQAEALETALHAVLDHHDALRLRVLDGALDHAPPSDLSPALLTTADTTGVQNDFDLSSGRLLRAVHITLDDQDERLLIAAHHLAVDGVSWRILLEDLATAYHQAASRQPVQLPAKTTSYQAWARHLVEHADHPKVTQQIPHWTQVLQRAKPLPQDSPGEAATNTYADSGTVVISLGAEATKDLLSSSTQEVLLAALGQTLTEWTGDPHVVVDTESHGRHPLTDDIDLTRTVGWFTAIRPITLLAAQPAIALQQIRQQIHTISDNGLGYSVLRHHRTDPATAELRALPSPQVCFNYLGQVDRSFASDQPWQMATEPTGANMAPANPRPYLLEVGALVAGGQLRIKFDYATRAFRRETVLRLAEEFRDRISALARNTEAIEDVYRLSPMQEGMLVHTLRASEDASYVVQMAARLHGELRPDLLRSAWRRVIERHTVLRTSIHWEDLERPLQMVHRQVPTPLVLLDWREHGQDEQRAKMSALLQDDRASGFELSRAPLFRLTLVRLDDDLWQLIWTHHHVLVDGWSMQLIVQEFFAGYEAESQGSPLALPPARPYRDYIAWLDRQDPAQAEVYWRRHLAGFHTPTPLPAETMPRTGLASGYAVEEIRLPEPATTDLGRLARRLGLTSSTLVNAAWALLLSRHSGEDDVVFGMTVADRPHELADVETMIGLLINTLPARASIPADQRVGDWLRGLHARLLEMHGFAYPSLVQMQGWSEVPRGQSLFDSIVVFENHPGADSAGGWLAGIEAQQVHAEEQTDYPLTLGVGPGDRMLLSLLYGRDRYTPDTCRRLLGQLRRLLAGMAADPDQTLDELTLLDPREREQLLIDWNPAAVDAPAEPLLHQLVERHAADTPEAIALVGEDSHLTYSALNARANRLARLLRRRGVGPEVRVGVFLDRSPTLLVALLAVLKAGGAYLPLDQAYPPERRAHLLADAGASLILCDRPDDALPPGVPILALDGLAETLTEESPENLPDTAEQDNLAYVIYTSGSTGQPKGVQISHRNLAAAAAAWQPAYDLTSADRHLQMASATFDVFTGDLARALGSGATLVLCPRDLLLDPAALAERLDEQQITCAEFVPVVLRYLVSALREREARLPALQVLISGGDAWHTRDHAGVRAIGGPGLRVINSYGVTEATIDSTYFDGTMEGEDDEAPVPIGRPLGLSRVYVLDRHGRPAPVGVPGELYIGGPQVGRGYVNRAGLTAERFVPDALSGRPGECLYRTGDRARWRADGTVEFLGRLDQQVKLRGFRIEPGEVEAALCGHPAVRTAVVIVRSAAPGEPQLVGYVVPREGAPAAGLVEALRAEAAKRLPAYMVPGAIVLLDALPLTVSGKLDRAALPAAEAVGSLDHTPPETPAEKALAGVWSQVLGAERIGLEDNFFGLGGDSIVSLQVVARARAAGWLVTPRQVFERQSLRELAAAAVPASTAGSRDADQGIVTGPVPLTPIQAAFFAEERKTPHHYNQAVMLRARGPVRTDVLEKALRRLVEHHDTLRLRFLQDEGGWRQEQASMEDVPEHLLQVEDLRSVPSGELSAVVEAIAAEAQTTLSLTAGCLLQAVHFDAGPARPARLLVIVHHLAVDAVSWRILLEDLERAYAQILAGEPVSLPLKTTPFRDWARHLEHRARGDEIGAEADFWLTALRAGMQTGLTLDLLPDEGEALQDTNTRADLATVVVALDAEHTRLLLQEVPLAYRARIDEILLTAVGTALAEWMDEPRLLVDLEGHGREDVGPQLDLSRTVGWFTSVHPVLLEMVPGDPVAAVNQVKERLRRVPGPGLGYGLLRFLRHDPPAQRLADLPPAAISFNYLGQFDQSFQAEGLWEPAEESEGPGHPLSAPRSYLLEIDAMVLAGELRVTWSYSDRLHHRSTLAALADRCLDVLRTLIDHRKSPEVGDRTAADFADTGLSQGELGDLLARFSSS
ncbi:MAG: Non-ribosomal peptide synthetase, partial [Actinomycetia bacterium]|nr:Non-ribosomal peptide synthetase [Actinomycetes bacterium]